MRISTGRSPMSSRRVSAPGALSPTVAIADGAITVPPCQLHGQLPPGRPGQEVSFHPPAVGVGVLPVKHRHRPRLAGQRGRLHKLFQVGDLPGHGKDVVEAGQGWVFPPS